MPPLDTCLYTHQCIGCNARPYMNSSQIPLRFRLPLTLMPLSLSLLFHYSAVLTPISHSSRFPPFSFANHLPSMRGLVRSLAATVLLFVATAAFAHAARPIIANEGSSSLYFPPVSLPNTASLHSPLLHPQPVPTPRHEACAPRALLRPYLSPLDAPAQRDCRRVQEAAPG